MSTKWQSHGLQLTDAQKKSLMSGGTIRLTHSALHGPHKVLIGTMQHRRMMKAKTQGKGMQLKFSPTQIRAQRTHGGSLGDILKAGAKSLVKTYAPAALAAGGKALGNLVGSKLGVGDLGAAAGDALGNFVGQKVADKVGEGVRVHRGRGRPRKNGIHGGSFAPIGIF